MSGSILPYKHILFALVILGCVGAFAMMPFTAQAQVTSSSTGTQNNAPNAPANTNTGNQNSSSANQPGTTGPGGTSGNTTGPNAGGIKLNNPIPSVGTVDALILKLANAMLIVGIPIVVLGLLYAGFMFVFARGSPEKIKEAKNILMGVVIGAVLILGAQVFARLIKSTICNVAGGCAVEAGAEYALLDKQSVV